jgi:phospholipid/cholesterol/gamma-HCH transport system substrate-binding protein
MKRDSINYLVVGLVVLAGLGMLLYALYRLTGGVDENTRYFVQYPNVGGLSEGTPVTYEGYKIGSVVAIEPMREGNGTRYRLTLLLRDGWPIPRDSVAYITSEGLLAETVINIREGSSPDVLAAGAELPGAMAVDVFSAVNDVATNVNRLLETEVRQFLGNLDGRISALGDQFDQRLPLLLDSVEQLIATLQAAADRLPAFVDADTEQRLGRMVANGVDITEKLLVFTDHLSRTQVAADALVRESRETVGENREDIRRATLALRRSLERLAADSEAILDNLDGAARNMNEFSRQIRQNPGLLLSGRPAQEAGDGDER